MTLLKMVKNILLTFIQELSFENYALAFAKAIAIELSQNKYIKNIELQKFELIEVE
ncbi:MAG: hypothetical protein QG670_2071 [Thermoproteota archaeon]|nr:hypothetical protein [Thermoproteota archaeon]